MHTNDALRTLRESLNLSMQEVAEGANVSFRTVLRAEQGYPLNPGSRQRLCAFYGKTADELGLVPQRRRGETAYQSQPEPEIRQQVHDLDMLQAIIQKMQVAAQNLEQEEIDMNHSRRFFLQALGVAGIALTTSSEASLYLSAVTQERPGQIQKVSASTIENLAHITQQYRALHRAGVAIEDGLRGHIALIQSALENTLHEGSRRELWRIQAQSQLLARQATSRKRELGRARTWNESSIASAQYSGDAYLMGAALGHLGHLYLTWQQNPQGARQLLDQAREYAGAHPIRGWFSIVNAAIAATEENADECKTSIAQALEIAHDVSHLAEADDPYYTDFNTVGVKAFAGNCLLKVGEPVLALEQLTSIDANALSSNRHASALHDIASAYEALGDLETTQKYALRSLDKALETDRLYIIPRCITLAQKIQARAPYDSHASAIVEYAQSALQTKRLG
ncbi:helix-turn-helix domain-containing protein [Ktedonobacter racemifer]|uniref:Helix-turn-helix domain protein n=1 Tax=Ktedonobacter racemifer DSM 44963 TaxID=485913 RepID=D6U0Y7_KTERA|nr:helix-turn-helix transcriptional regulator [Ktedonobacter racemifer]EFH82477.1 helix-turn-helix domain protein [Ktedonobacter racemifer DSM 44963]